MQLHAAFPELDIDLVNDFLAECHGDVRQAMMNIESLLGPSKVRGRGSPCLERWLPVQSTNKSAAPASQPKGVVDHTIDAWEIPLPSPAATNPATLLPRESCSPPPMTMPHLFPMPLAAKQPGQLASRPVRKGSHKGVRPEKLKPGPGAAVSHSRPQPVNCPEEDQRQQPDVSVSVSGQQKALESQPAAAPATPNSQVPVDWEGLLPRPAQPSRLVGLPVPLPAESPSGSRFDGNPKNPKHARSSLPSGILELLNLPDEAKAALQQPSSEAKAAAAPIADQLAQQQLDDAPAVAVPSVTPDAVVENTLWDAGSPEGAPSEHAAKLEFLQVPYLALPALACA